MKNELIRTFEHEQFGNVRVVLGENQEPWFVGKDVAKTLGYRDTSDALKKHVDKEDKLSRQFAESGQNREMYIINESGLYSLILSSKLPSARAFKRWVTSEVLPSIRQMGVYAPNVQFLQQAFTSQLVETIKQDIKQEVMPIIEEIRREGEENHRPSQAVKVKWHNIIKSLAQSKEDIESIKELTLSFFNAGKWEDIPYNKNAEVVTYIKQLANQLKKHSQVSFFED